MAAPRFFLPSPVCGHISNHGGNYDDKKNCRGGTRGVVPAAAYGGERVCCGRKLEKLRGRELDTEPDEVAFSEYAGAEDGEVASPEG